MIPQLDGNFSGSSDEDVMNNRMSDISEQSILQLDGSSDDVALSKKAIFSVNCEIRELTEVITFFRSYNFIWQSLACHDLCSTGNCFFCHMRSTCLRLDARRGRGPKGLKLVEFISQLNQYQSKLGWNWKESPTDLPVFIENTIKLLGKHERQINDVFQFPILQCQRCKKTRNTTNQLVYEVNTSALKSGTKDVILKMLIDALIPEKNLNQCCHEHMLFNDPYEKCVILKLSHPINLIPTHSQQIYGRHIFLKSFVIQETAKGKKQQYSNSSSDGTFFYQNEKNDIC